MDLSFQVTSVVEVEEGDLGVPRGHKVGIIATDVGDCVDWGLKNVNGEGGL